ncbi:right-handed parallel beta-helix repeat-containing protein [Nannocystis pusilla]|uniref:right-handed parallel beta-helix repeat-containing protein n=1 Tax=Nannocystis pusilla TaxID=889268 RepID=UPI003BF301EA
MISSPLFSARRAPQVTWIAVALLGAAAACGGSTPADETGSGSETSGSTTVEASTSETAGSSGTADPTTSSTATTFEPTTTSATTAETTETSSAVSTDASTGTSTSTTGDLPACVLGESGPIVVEADDQVIENLHIVSTRGPAITVEGHAGVTIRNVWIEHAGGPGIAIGGGSDDIHIENVAIEHTGAPAAGQNPSDGLNNIECYGSARPVVTNARLVRGSSGIYLVECPDAELSFLEGHDFRGPFPRGQLVQFDKSNGGVLEDFSVVNPQASSWPEDNVNIYQSVDVAIRRGMIDGNNSPSGVGVIFDGDLALGVVEDVDAIRMGNGCFSDYAGSDGVVFRRTRCRENICEDQGRGAPLSNALMWAGHPGYTKIRLEDSHYFASCNGNLVWPDESFEVIELDELDFTMREPIVVPLCWE